MSGDFLKPSSEKNVYVPRQNRSEILRERFERLPTSDQSLFQSSSYFLALNGGLCGLIGNSLFRRVLNITQAPIASALPMAVIPFLSTVAVYEVAITQPLLEGELNCASCALIRGGLIGAIVGCLYPALIALPMNAALATRYATSLMPNKENILRFWITVSKPVFKKLRFVMFLQVAFGMYLSSRQHEIYIKMLQMPEPGNNPEELKE